MFNILTDKNKLTDTKPLNGEENAQSPIEPGVIRVDLHDYGFKQAGATGADPSALKNYLEDIHNGFIVDVNENEDEQRREREKREGEIDKLSEEKTNKESALRKIREAETPSAKEQISRLKTQASELDVERAKPKGETKRSSFNLNLYWPVFVMATIFLYGFYMSAFHTAFFKDMAKSLSEANSDNISELLNTVFNKQAFLEFNLHWFAPIIFFVFAMVLHIAFDTDKNQRPYFLAGTLLLILIADCLLAYFIEYNSHLIQTLNGMTDEIWAFYKSPRFYLVLFLGFFTCLGWSLILHAIKMEYSKEDFDEVIRLQKQQLREKEAEIIARINEMQKSAIDIEGQIQQIALLIERKTKQLNNLVYSVSDLEKRITAFYAGWLTFVANLKNNAALKTANETVINEFRNLHLKKSENQFQNQSN
jgi:hypothetical protein